MIYFITTIVRNSRAIRQWKEGPKRRQKAMGTRLRSLTNESETARRRFCMGYRTVVGTTFMTPVSPTTARGGNRIASLNGRHECRPYDVCRRVPHSAQKRALASATAAQLGQNRRRRMAPRSSVGRESLTCVSSVPQNGQRISFLPVATCRSTRRARARCRARHKS